MLNNIHAWTLILEIHCWSENRKRASLHMLKNAMSVLDLISTLDIGNVQVFAPHYESNYT